MRGSGDRVISSPTRSPAFGTAASRNTLYTQQSPNAAAARFRKLLERNPRHYRATFQLAMALDRAGRPAEAHLPWEKALEMAEENKDKAAADTARAAGEARRAERGGGAGVHDGPEARRL